MQRLTEHEARVWYASPDDITDRATIEEYREVLCDAERVKCARLRNQDLQHRYLVGHALVRIMLSCHAGGVAPHKWSFRAGPHGRPEIASPSTAEPLRFNLSHTRGLVACGVTTNDAIGVDVESHHRRLDFSDFAARHFSSLEVDSLNALPAEQRAERFFLYWTLKESYLKARGDGLRIPLNWFGFRVTPAGPIEVSLDPRLLDDPRRWHFEVRGPTPSHSLAVAVHRLCRGRTTIEAWDGHIPT